VTDDVKISMYCPKCGTQYRVPETTRGKKVRCKKCGEVFSADMVEMEPVEEDMVEVMEDVKILTFCPKCGAQYRVSETTLGKQVQCKKCGAVFTVAGMVEMDLVEEEEPQFDEEPQEEVQRSTGFHKQRIALAIAAGAGVGSIFLPWYSLFGVGISGTQTEGWWLIPVLFAPALILAFVGNRSKPLVGALRLIAVIPAVLASVIGVGMIADLQSKLKDVPKDNPFAEVMAMGVKAGIGLYLFIAAGLALMFIAWVCAYGGKSGERKCRNVRYATSRNRRRR
jgi:predicted Zn finger-like uncharacterized protein